MELKKEEERKKKSLLFKVGKALAWIVASLIFLIILAFILIQTSFVQNFARKKIVSYLENKLKTKVEIGKLDIKFPTSISLQNVFLEDQSKDTLLYGGELKVNINMLALIKKNISIKEITLNDIVVKVKRPDSVFNFQFIIDAFSSGQKSTTENNQDTSSLKINIDRILINKTRIVYKDSFSGNDMDLAIGHFDTRISTFDPSHLLFDIPSITLNGLKGHFYQTEPIETNVENKAPQSTTSPQAYLQLFNKEINLSDINVVYKSDPSQLNSSFVIGKAQLRPQKLDIKNSIYQFKELLLDNSDIAIETNIGSTNKKNIDTTSASTSASSMKIIFKKITVKNSNLNYDDDSAPKTPSGMDYSHLGIQQLSLNASNLEYSADTILANIKSASMKEKSGFVLNNLTTDFYKTPNGVFFYNLLLQTPGTELKNRAYITYSSLDAIKKNIGEMGLYIDLHQSKLSMKDLLTFVPQLKDKLSSFSPRSTLYINAKITGKVSDLNFQKLIIRGLNATYIDASGIVKGLPDLKKLYTVLSITKFQTSRNDLLSFIPEKSVPKTITLPESLAANGHIKGSMNDLYADLTMNTSLGSASVNGTLKNITNKNKALYNLSLKAKNVKLGTIMQNPKLGVLTGEFKVQGNGYDPQTANADFNGNISEITLNNYNYHNLNAEGSIANKNYKIKLTLQDPNLDATIAANGIFSGNLPTLHLKATIDSIKTMPLHFTSTPVFYHGDIMGDFQNINPDSLNGNLVLSNSILVNNGKRIILDSVKIIAEDTIDNQSLLLKTDFLSASINGKYKLTQLASVFQKAMDPYFSTTPGKDSVKTKPYNFTINAHIINNPTLNTLMPELTQLKPISFSGRFVSDSGWSVYLKSPHIVYGTSVIDSLNLNAETKNGSLAFNTSLRRFKSGSSLNVYATTLYGKIKNNNIDFTLNIKDQNSKNKYTVIGQLDKSNLNKYIFSLSPDSLLLNYQKWTVNTDNKIQFFNKDINAHNFILSQGTQQLSINSAGSGVNEPLQIDFKNFKIETISGFIQNDSLMVAGLMNGNAVVKNIQTDPAFTTDLTVNNLSVYKDTIGNLNLKVDNNVSNTYHADITLEGNGNDVNIKGNYLVKPVNSSYDFVVNIKSLQMKAVEGFSKGQLKNASGNLFGKIALNGSLDKPNIDGKIQFNNTAFTVTMLNNVFKIDKEAIAIINNNGIILNKFAIHDIDNNAIVIDGAVNTTNFLDYSFNLKINAHNFQAINSTSRDNQLFYGKMVFSTRLTIKGTPIHPIIDGDLTINDKTDFTVVLPQNQPGVESREGIVRFVDKSATAEDSLFMKPYDTLKTSPLQGYDVSLNIKVDKEAIFNVIVDAGNGDYLRLKGTAQLTAGIDASGKITMAGSYEIEEGSYDLSFNFLKRKFIIQKGSRIVWTGDPTTAQINITGIYKANTAPYDLVQDQIQSTTSNANIYKQKLPFEVHLILQGELLKPQISFDIVLPEDKNYNVADVVISTVEAKLAQIRQETGEMNKQVFALLLLNRFVGEDPFSNGAGSAGAGTLAMQSVSKLLSAQLNQLAQNLVQGVDINFDLATTQDYTTGTQQDRTNLNVGVSKKLLNDRLTVTVGSDFELQGPMQANQQQNNIAGNISVNYKLSKDGKYMLRAYRKNDYTDVIQGYVIETGIGFIISVDYNKFKEIFSTKEQRRKKREIRKKNKETQGTNNRNNDNT
ncbi:MAG TPA: translocation/assembly module TamB domain-containing protein [Hanamia sp.]|nr:translocation/assembly module TamB domain-containing protein [Hanamia sp.]